MKLGIKILVGFAILTVLLVIVGIVGTVNIKKIDDADTVLYEKMTLPIAYIGEITTDFNRIRVNVVNTARTKDPQLLANYEKSIEKYNENIKKQFRLYEKTYLNDEGKKVFEEFMKKYEQYYDEIKVVFNFIKSNNEAEAINLVNGKMKDIGFEINEMGSKITQRKPQRTIQFLQIAQLQ